MKPTKIIVALASVGLIGGAIAAATLATGSGSSGSAAQPYYAWSPQVARDGAADSPTATPTDTASPTATASATPTTPVVEPGTPEGPTPTQTPGQPSGDASGELAALVSAAQSASFKAQYSATGAGTVTIAQLPPNKRETIAGSQAAGGTVIGDGTSIYVCDDGAGTCTAHAPGDGQVAQAFTYPWWTSSAAAAIALDGARVSSAPGQTVAGINAACFQSNGGAIVLCLDPATGAVVSFAIGSGSSTFSVTLQSLSATVTSDDFALPYPIAAPHG
jgi:hypothetical protein